MYNLTPNYDPSSVFASFSLSVTIGITFFLAAIFIMVVASGWSIKKILDNSSSLAIILALTLSITVSTQLINNRLNESSSAFTDIKVVNLEVTRLDNRNAIVNLNTSEPALVYLEYKDLQRNDTTVVLSNYGARKNTNHSFMINNITTTGEAYIIIDGKRYLLNGNPIKIP